MTKFLFCLPRFHTNAVPWVRILGAAGHQAAVHVITRGTTEDYGMLRPTFLKESRLSAFLSRFLKDPGFNQTYAFPGFLDYWSVLSREDPDVVIVRGATRWFSRMAIVVALLQRRRVVIYDQEDPVPAARSTWLRRALFRAIGIPHVTPRLPQHLPVAGLGRAVPLPFGAPSDCKIDGILDKSPVPKLLMVAKYRARKGHGTLLHALAKCAADHPFVLTFCGEEDGPEDRAFVLGLQDLAISLGLSDRVSFRNSVPPAQMGELYREHDLFVLPSRNEPAAVSPIEAAWNGCAVLMSRGSGTRGYAPPGPRFDFDPDDADDIARAIRNALQSREHLEALRRLCHAHISEVAGDGTILSVFEGLRARSN